MTSKVIKWIFQAFTMSFKVQHSNHPEWTAILLYNYYTIFYQSRLLVVKDFVRFKFQSTFNVYGKDIKCSPTTIIPPPNIQFHLPSPFYMEENFSLSFDPLPSPSVWLANGLRIIMNKSVRDEECHSIFKEETLSPFKCR